MVEWLLVLTFYLVGDPEPHQLTHRTRFPNQLTCVAAQPTDEDAKGIAEHFVDEEVLNASTACIEQRSANTDPF